MLSIVVGAFYCFNHYIIRVPLCFCGSHETPQLLVRQISLVIYELNFLHSIDFFSQFRSNTIGFKWLKKCIMILMYSFFIILRLTLESVFKNTSSKRLDRISMFSNCAIQKMATLSLLTGISSGNYKCQEW